MPSSLDSQISEARRRAEDFSLTLENARREEMESMKAIEHERLKWAESYDCKVVMIEQLQRELAHTVEALHVSKSTDRGDSGVSFTSSRELSNNHSSSRILESPVSTSSRSGSSSPRSHAGDRYQHHDTSQLLHAEHRSQQNLRASPPRDHHQLQLSAGQYGLGTRHRAPSDISDTSLHPSHTQSQAQTLLVDSLQRELASLQQQVTALQRRESEAISHSCTLQQRLDEATAAWRDSEGKLRFRAQQAQEWATNREARDKIESELRARLGKYEAAAAACEGRCAHFEAQCRQLGDQLSISEQRNVILMEENKKHVKEFEHLKAQLEYQEILVGTSHSSSSHHLVQQSASNASVHNTKEHASSTEVLRKSEHGAHSEVRAAAGVALNTHTAEAAAAIGSESDDSRALAREDNLNKAFQTEEELERWLASMKRDSASLRTVESHRSHRISPGRHHTHGEEEGGREDTSEAGDESVSESVLHMRASASPPRAPAPGSWRSSELSRAGQQLHQASHHHDQLDRRHHDLQEAAKLPPPPPRSSNASPDRAQDQVFGRAVNMSPAVFAVAVNRVVVKQQQNGLMSDRSLFEAGSQFSHGNEENQRRGSSDDSEGEESGGKSDGEEDEDEDGDEDALGGDGDDLMDTSADIVLGSPIKARAGRCQRERGDSPSVSSASILLDYQNLQHDTASAAADCEGKAAGAGGGGISGFFLRTQPSPVQIKVKQRKIEKTTINKKTKTKLEGKSAPRSRAERSPGAAAAEQAKRRVSTGVKGSASVSKKQPSAASAASSATAAAPRRAAADLGPDAVTFGQAAAQRRLASAAAHQCSTTITTSTITHPKAAVSAPKRAKTSAGVASAAKKPPTGRASSSSSAKKAIKDSSKSVKRATVRHNGNMIVDRDSIEVTSVQSSLSLQSLSLERLPPALPPRPSPSTGHAGGNGSSLVRRQLVRNVSKYPLQANIHSTVSSSVSTRMHATKLGRTDSSSWK